MRTLVTSLCLLAAAACGDDPDPTAAACGKILDAACTKFVECRVVKDGVQFSTSVCAQIRARAITKCEMEEGAALRSASDSDVNQCASEMSAQACADICGKAPADPPTCRKISPSPNTETITCAP